MTQESWIEQHIREHKAKETLVEEHLSKVSYEMYTALQEAGIESQPTYCLHTRQATATIGCYYLAYDLKNTSLMTGKYSYRPYGKRALILSDNLEDAVYRIARLRKGHKVSLK